MGRGRIKDRYAQ